MVKLNSEKFVNKILKKTQRKLMVTFIDKTWPSWFMQLVRKGKLRRATAICRPKSMKGPKTKPMKRLRGGLECEIERAKRRGMEPPPSQPVEYVSFDYGFDGTDDVLELPQWQGVQEREKMLVPMEVKRGDNPVDAVEKRVHYAEHMMDDRLPQSQGVPKRENMVVSMETESGDNPNGEPIKNVGTQAQSADAVVKDSKGAYERKRSHRVEACQKGRLAKRMQKLRKQKRAEHMRKHNWKHAGSAALLESQREQTGLLPESIKDCNNKKGEKLVPKKLPNRACKELKKLKENTGRN